LLPCGGLLRSTVRISSIDDELFLHTAYPTLQEEAVFFGPDTYRFARFIQQALRNGEGGDARLQRVASRGRPFRVLDVGCGSGAGALVAARALDSAGSNAAVELTMNDINPLALQYAKANAANGRLQVKLAEGDALSAVGGQFDLIISNPPYLHDAARRTYRHGGARLGRALSVRIAQESLGRLAPGGQLLLYTGVAIVDGVDPFRAEMLPLLNEANCAWSYSEIDPDVFGEELEQPVYAHVDRIAAVGLIVTRRRGGEG
jgi:methylase of polypeptide subunit release factors